MDKVLKYKFWILASLVIPLALAGFFIANGGLQGATAERVSALEGLQPPNPNQPNETHTAVATKEAEEMELANAQQLRRLDQIQRAWMEWPPQILEGLEKNPETGELVYRGENIPETIANSIRVRYPDEYIKEIERVWLSVNPVVPDDLPFSDQSDKKVFCPIEVIPYHQLSKTPTIQEIWDAQEDVWILEMLIAAINATNQSAANVNESAIREIMYLELFGGTGESSVVAMATGDPSATGGEYMGPGYMMGAGGGAPAGPGLSVAFANGAIAYDPQMEYGSQAGAAAAGSGDGMYMTGDGGLFGPGSGAAAAKPLRYIGFDEASPTPYRKRGFMISLLIQEKKIPDFIVNLGNLDPPIYAGRWAFANNPYDTDHLLKAGFAGIGGAGSFSGAESYAGGGAKRPVRRNPLGGGSGEYDTTYTQPGFGGAAGGRMNVPHGLNDPQRPLTPKQLAQMASFEPAKQGKDLVHLELSGVVTIFTPDVSTLPKPEEASPESPAAAPVAEVAPAVETAPAPAAAPTGTPSPDAAAAPAAAPVTAPEQAPASAPASEAAPAPTEPPSTETAPPAETPPAAPGT